MISFELWLQREVGKSRKEIYQSGNAAATDTERRLRRVRSARERRESMERDFVTRMGHFLFWLHHGMPADGTSDVDWQAAKPICDSLAEQENSQ